MQKYIQTAIMTLLQLNQLSPSFIQMSCAMMGVTFLYGLPTTQNAWKLYCMSTHDNYGKLTLHALYS